MEGKKESPVQGSFEIQLSRLQFLAQVSRPWNSPPGFFPLPLGLMVLPSELFVLPSGLVATPLFSFLFHEDGTL